MTLLDTLQSKMKGLVGKRAEEAENVFISGALKAFLEPLLSEWQHHLPPAARRLRAQRLRGAVQLLRRAAGHHRQRPAGRRQRLSRTSHAEPAL